MGIGIGDRVFMMEHSYYSVISPEGCAAILWKQANDETTREAANALRLTAADNLKFGIVDDAISESLGGAHRDPKATAATLEAWIDTHLTTLKAKSIDELLQARYDRFRRLGEVEEAVTAEASPHVDPVSN